MALQPKSGLGHLILRFLDHTHIDTYAKQNSSEWVISSSQRLFPTQHTTNTTDEHPNPQWDSNPWSQQWSGCRQQRIILQYFCITVATISKKNKSCSTLIHFFKLHCQILIHVKRSYKMTFKVVHASFIDILSTHQNTDFYNFINSCYIIVYKKQNIFSD